MNGSSNSINQSIRCGLTLIQVLFLILSVELCTNCKKSTSGKDPGLISDEYLKRTVYINLRSGNDKNPGTITKPLRSVAEAGRRISHRPANLFFAGGQVYEGTLVIENQSHSDSVLIGSYGEGRAVIDGGLSESIRIENCRFISVRDLDLHGKGRKEGNTANGLSAVNCSDCLIENLTAEGFQKSGIDLYNCRNILVDNVIASGNGFCGINVMGSSQDSSENIIILNCKAENNPGDPSRLDNHSGNGILVGVSDSVTIDHCIATGNGWDMPRKGNGPVGIWAWMSDHVRIQYCISYRNKTSIGGKDGGGFDLDGGVTNSLIQYCLSYENEGAGYGLFQYPGASVWKNNVIRYCVSINDAHTTEGAGSFFIWNGTDDSSQLTGCYIYNNVAVNTSAPVVSFENASDHQNFIFSNNIFMGSGQLLAGINKGSRFLGNVWWNTGGKITFMDFNTMLSWAKVTGQETDNGTITGLQTDPLLNGPLTTDLIDPYQLDNLFGFKLKANSPLRNKGIIMDMGQDFDSPSVDFFGNPLPQGQGLEPGIHQIN